MGEPYWREVVAGFAGGERLIESLLAADDEAPATGAVEERHEDNEFEPVSHVHAVAEEFANHFRVTGALPPPALAASMFETARANDEFAAERAVQKRAEAGDGGAHWRVALRDDALVE